MDVHLRVHTYTLLLASQICNATCVLKYFQVEEEYPNDMSYYPVEHACTWETQMTDDGSNDAIHK